MALKDTNGFNPDFLQAAHNLALLRVRLLVEIGKINADDREALMNAYRSEYDEFIDLQSAP